MSLPINEIICGDSMRGVFRSCLEDLMVAEELRFKATSGFGSVYKRFLSHSIAHPAKMNTRLTEFLIERFTAKGDLVLDPMAGSGQTGVISALHGRDAVCVDIEKKFFGWMEKARMKVERQKTLAAKGRIQNICGDARKLTNLLKEVDTIVTSPPYSETFSVNAGGGSKKSIEGMPKLHLEKGVRLAYSLNGKNIGNLRHGCVDAIISSPPYGESYLGGGDAEKRKERLVKSGHNPKDFLGGKARNAILKHYPQVDVVVTSPPYADVEKRDRGKEEWFDEEREKQVHGCSNIAKGYQGSKENIGNLRFVDTVITSPPYEETVAVQDVDFYKQKCVRTGRNPNSPHIQANFKYGDSKENIGNLKKETYLSAMLIVYREMFNVLKPNGKAIIVIKPFIRNKKVVDLPYHTWLLLKKAGFTLVKLFKLRLKTQSFWRILYTKKHPSVPQIKHEYVLICQK